MTGERRKNAGVATGGIITLLLFLFFFPLLQQGQQCECISQQNEYGGKQCQIIRRQGKSLFLQENPTVSGEFVLVSADVSAPARKSCKHLMPKELGSVPWSSCELGARLMK